MIKKGLQLVTVIIIVMSLNACKAKRGGCGLTSDAVKMEQQIHKIHKENLVSSTIK